MFKTDVTIEQLTREIVDFLSIHIRVSRMILFGSYAYGQPRKDSDFDIVVISPDLAGMNILEKMELFAKAAIAVDSRIELKGFSEEKFLHPEQGSLLEMIKNSGKTIYPAISGQDQKEGVPLIHSTRHKPGRKPRPSTSSGLRPEQAKRVEGPRSGSTLSE